MKLKLLMTILTFFIAQQCINITAGYESTPREEAIARTSTQDEAFLTSREEEIARTEPVDEAYITKNQEEFWRQAGTDDAHVTKAAEEAARN